MCLPPLYLKLFFGKKHQRNTYTHTLVTCIYYFLMQHQQSDPQGGTQKITWFFISNQLLLSSLTDLAAHIWFLLNTPGFPLLLTCKQSPQVCVINIHSTPRGRAAASNSCWDTGLVFFLFSASRTHRRTTQDCFEVSIFIPPQITTEKQTLAECQNSPDKTKQSMHLHGKNGRFFVIFQTNKEWASDLAWLLQGWCLLHKREAEGGKQNCAVLLSSLTEMI